MSDSGRRPTEVDASVGKGVQVGDKSTQVNNFSGNEPRQEVSTGRDGYAAGQNLTINNNYGPAAVERGPAAQVVVGMYRRSPRHSSRAPG